MTSLSIPDKRLFKLQLKEACSRILMERIHTVEAAMEQAQDSANSEDKSTAGDKYETARAMGQMDRDMNAKQLLEAQKEYAFLQGIPIDQTSPLVAPGSVVEFAGKLFFMAVGLGSIDIEGNTVIVLSTKAPLYDQLKHKSLGDKFVFQNQNVLIEAIF